MKRFRFLARVLLLGFFGTAFAAPFQNGSFEVGTPTADPCNIALPIGSTAITGWTVIAGNIEYVTTCWLSSEGARSLDLVGNGNIGGVSQTFDTAPGATYQVSFDLSGNPSTIFPPAVKPLAVTVAGTTRNYTFNTTGRSAPANMGWTTQSFSFVATGPNATIDFVSDVGASSFAGAALDNVSIVLVSAPTSTGLFSSINPSGFGSAVTFTVQVTGLVNSPTGTIDFTDGGTPIAGCTAVPVGPTGSPLIATADCVVPLLAIGSHTIFAAYSGDAINASSGNSLLQVVNAVAIGGTVWNGTAGNVVNPFGGPGGTPIPIASAPTVVSDGTTGPAIFTYQTANSYCCHSGDWAFHTTAAAPAPLVTLNWTYSGYHGTCGAHAELTAFVIRAAAADSSATVYSASDTNCSFDLPSAGHGVHGQVILTSIAPGDTYGFEMRASNGDLNGAVGGRLTVTTGTLPTSTTLVSSFNPAPVGGGVDFTATITGSSPTGSVLFTREGRPLPGCDNVPVIAGAAVCTTSFLFDGNNSIVASYTGDAVNAGSISNTLVQIMAVTPGASAPTVIRAIALSANDGFVVARAEGVAGPSIGFTLFTAPTCVNGALGLGGQQFNLMSNIDANGHFGESLPNVAPGVFVAVQVTSPVVTPTSACIVVSSENDVWPKAFGLGALTTASDYIDAPGKARWYKFSIAPGQKVQLTLSGLPADYDLVVFRDIFQAFTKQLVPANASDLNKLSAEFAPSTFSPSTFSPSTFSPSTFSPDAYSPSTFSPSTFSPSTFSPSTFSPSTFSPSTFSPSTFSPSTFSPSTFSPSTFSPSTFSPSTFSPSDLLRFDATDVEQAFSSAQTRSILGVSATPGTGSESVVLNTWNNTGDFYVRVAGRGGAFSTSSPFTLTVAKSGTSCASVAPLPPPATPRTAAAAGITSVILTDSSRLALDVALPGGGTLRAKLLALAASVGGVLVDVDGDGRVRSLRDQAADKIGCPYAMNLVAEEIKTIVDSYRANNALRHVVIVGNDGVIPFFRYPDESLLGQESSYVPPVRNLTASDASLSQDYVLSQDAYGSSTRIAMRGIDFPIPGLGVGRLVETPSDIAGLIDAFLANGVVEPASSLVTGYDFLTSAADVVKTELQAGTGVAPTTLITPKDKSPQDPASWTALDLATALFGPRNDVIFLAGHFSANSALAADFSSTILTTDLLASATDFTNTIVFSAGCHAGYNIVDPDAIDGVTLKLDWPQAFARKKATLIAGTGYQYGDTEFIEYSARLYTNFARQLRSGVAGTAISLGDALNRAKIDYLATTPDIRGIHQKALLETTIYGLPMLGVDMPFRRAPTPTAGAEITPAPVASGPAAALGLQIAQLVFSPSIGAPLSICLKNPPYDAGAPGVPPPPCPDGYTEATWLQGPNGGVTANAAEPVLPLQIVNVTPTTDIALRGVGFVGGSYTESTVVPLTGAPTTELRGVHTPFLSPVFYPMRLATPNYVGSLSGAGGTSLLVNPAQHRAADVAQGTSILRRFSGLELRLYYSGNTTAAGVLSAAPTIVTIDAVPDNGGVIFAARVVGDPAAAVHDVWVTHTSGSGPNGTWSSLPLEQCSATPPLVCGTTTDSQQWMGRLATAPANLKYIVQAVNGFGLVSADDNLGVYYAFGGTAPAATTLSLKSAPSGGTYGSTATITANLSAGGNPVVNKQVTVAVGGASQTGVTDGNGDVTVGVPVSSPPSTNAYPLTASFNGDEALLPSSISSAGFVVSKAASSLAALSLLPGATLTGTIGGKPQPIDGSVAFTLTSSRSPSNVTAFAITNYLGEAILPPPGLAAGNYAIIDASFAGNATYTSTTLAFSTTFTIPKADQTIDFAQPPARTYGDDFSVAASTGSGLVVSFAATGDCAVTGTSVHLTASGSCTITASQAGNDDFNAATPVVRTFGVNKGTLIVSPTVSPAAFAFGDDLAPSPIALTFGVTYSGTVGSLACLLGSVQPILTPTAPAAPVPAGTYSFMATIPAAQFSTSCNPLVSNTATLSVGRAQATFANIVVPPTAPARTTVTVTGQLHRLDKPAIFPKTADLAGGAFAVALRNAGGTVKTFTPSLVTPDGSFTFSDGTLAPDTYSLEFNYAGGPNFLAATKVTSSLRVVGSASTGNMNQPRTSHTATLLNDGRVLVAGGSGVGDDDRRASRTAEIYCPNPYTPPATPARTLAQWCPNGLGKFSPAGRGNTTQVGKGNLLQSRTYHTATLLPNGTVLLVGGYDGSGVTTATAELYDPTDPIADKFTAVPNLPANAAAGHTATLVTKNSKAYVLVIGGLSASSQLYDTTTKTWSRTGSMTAIRSGHTASLVGTRVFVAGGTDLLSRTLQTTTIYDIGNGTFSNGPTMLAPREWHAATAIASGKVLLSGGRASTGVFTNTVALSPLAEIYDPGNATTPFAAATFASGTGRFNHSASALIAGNGQPDGRVLVAGGAINVLCGQQLATSEVYGSSGFTTGSTLAAARVRHAATVLKDGRVLVTGGRGTVGSRCGPLNTAEIWNGPAP